MARYCGFIGAVVRHFVVVSTSRRPQYRPECRSIPCEKDSGTGVPCFRNASNRDYYADSFRQSLQTTRRTLKADSSGGL